MKNENTRQANRARERNNNTKRGLFEEVPMKVREEASKKRCDRLEMLVKDVGVYSQQP
jgi:hypothetical protein